jgi:predicted DNA-binding transcriptional regulator AlpA
MSTVANDPAPLAGGLTPMLDAGDVARIFGIERNTVLDWIQRGRLPKPIRVARTIRWPRAVIEAHVEALAAGAAR